MGKRTNCSVKNTKLFFGRKIYALMTLILGIFLFVSCANDGFNNDEKFSSEVVNATLESPKVEDIVCTPSADGAKITIKWPVVYGAGGYKFSLYIVDDPNNPVAVGAENEIVDGCSATRTLQEDTKYKVVIKTMGNTKYNNSDAQAATEISYSTLLATYATIPSGTDITTYFANNPIPDNDKELAYNLEAGGTYTMSGVVDFGKHLVTLRGDKINHPKVTYSSAARLCTSAGLKIKFIDFDCSAQDGLAADASFLSLSATPNNAILGTGSYYIITDPIVVQSCKVTGVKGYIFYNNQKKYCVKTFVMKNDIFQCNSAQTSTAYIYFNKGDGAINDFTAQNSTFYDLNATGNKYFIQYGNSARPDRPGLVTGSLNFYNNTFYNIAYAGQMGNYSGMNSNIVYLNVAQNIFYNCGGGAVCRRLMGGTNMNTFFSKNSYWYNGAFTTGELSYDKSNTAIQAEPTFNSVATGDFTVTSTDHKTAQCGDPRWLPAE